MVQISTFLMGSPDPNVYSMTDDIIRTDSNIPLDVVIDLAGKSPFWGQRGQAIESYAQLEQALCSLFSYCGEMPRDVASIIFFKITSSAARNAVVEKLLREKFGNKYNLFWNSYLKQLRIIDLKRNEIVHWLTAVYSDLDANKKLVVGVNLIPPSMIRGENSRPYLSSKDLIEFDEKCSVYARMVNSFLMMFNVEAKLDAAWTNIFMQPLVYPLLEDHPLNQPKRAPGT